MIDENKIKSKGPEKVTFVEMVAVSIQRLMSPKLLPMIKRRQLTGF